MLTKHDFYIRFVDVVPAEPAWGIDLSYDIEVFDSFTDEPIDVLSLSRQEQEMIWKEARDLIEDYENPRGNWRD